MTTNLIASFTGKTSFTTEIKKQISGIIIVAENQPFQALNAESVEISIQNFEGNNPLDITPRVISLRQFLIAHCVSSFIGLDISGNGFMKVVPFTTGGYIKLNLNQSILVNLDNLDASIGYKVYSIPAMYEANTCYQFDKHAYPKDQEIYTIPTNGYDLATFPKDAYIQGLKLTDFSGNVTEWDVQSLEYNVANITGVSQFSVKDGKQYPLMYDSNFYNIPLVGIASITIYKNTGTSKNILLRRNS